MNNNTITAGEAVDGFRQAMADAGLNLPNSIVADGQIHRFSTNGKSSNKDGWYCLHLDGLPAGVAGCWRQGFKQNWCAKSDNKLTPEERWISKARWKEASAEALRQRQKEQEAAAAEALKQWNAAGEVDANHAYLTDKNVKAYGLKQSDNVLLVPLKNNAGKLISLQSITPDGTKRFFSGCSTKGVYHLIGEPNGCIYIAEGYATAATIHQVTGQAVAVALTAGNLQPVSEAVREKFSDAELILAADDDASTDGNPGIKKATEAAAAIGGKIAIPDFGNNRPEGVTDFNDLAAAKGLDAVKAQLKNARPVKWLDPEPLTNAGEPSPYPIDHLPEVLREAVEEMQGFIQAPVALVANSALSALSVAGQSLADVKRMDGLSGPCSLFVLTIAESGERKTTADGKLQSAITEWEREQEEAIKPEVDQWRANHEVWDAEKDALKSEVRKHRPKGGQKFNDARDELQHHLSIEPEKPKIPRVLREDSTQEALGYGLAKEWPSAGLITSEGGSVFGSHGMGKDSQSRMLALMNKLWDGGTHTVARRTVESFTVRGVRLTVGIQVQQAPLIEFINSTPGLARGIGFFARFLIAIPISTQGTRLFSNSAPANFPALNSFSCRIKALLETDPKTTEDGTLLPPMIPLDAEAQKVFIKFHDDVEKELRPSGQLADVKDSASKAADNAARLACLFHLLEHGPIGEINANTFRQGAALAEWYLMESKRFFMQIAVKAEILKAQKLEAWLMDHCKMNGCESIPAGDVLQFGPVRRAKDRDALLKILEEANRVRLVADGKKKRIEINPALVEL